MMSIQIVLFALLPFSTASVACPSVISRSEWGAKSPKSVTFLTKTPDFVVVHHSEGQTCDNKARCIQLIKNTQLYHMNNKGWTDIGYNFLIGGDGNVYEGRGWGVKGAHHPKYNSRSLGICIIGNFQDVAPNDAQIAAAKSLIECAQSGGKIEKKYHLIGHRQGRSTECPGDALFEIIKNWSNFDESIK